jgi:hypothetical protein
VHVHELRVDLPHICAAELVMVARETVAE